jgi:uncharacterized protein YfaS (alpha-2-macroglobulin family)
MTYLRTELSTNYWHKLPLNKKVANNLHQKKLRNFSLQIRIFHYIYSYGSHTFFAPYSRIFIQKVLFKNQFKPIFMKFPLTKLTNQHYLLPLAKVLLLALLFGCNKTGSILGNKDAVTLSSKNFGEEIDLQQNLSFSFSDDIAHDTLLDKWQNTPYIEFSPEVAGKFKWVSNSELVFSPEGGFVPSTDYTATLTNKLFAAPPNPEAKFELGGEKIIKFHTPYLSMLSANANWVMNTQGELQVQLSLKFNYPVFAQEVAKRTLLKLGENRLDFTVAEQGETTQVELILSKPSMIGLEGKVIDILIEKGLTSTKSTYTAGEMKFEAEVVNPKDFRVLQVQSEYATEGFAIHVYTNQMVSNNEAQIKNFITLEPTVEKLKIEKLDVGFLVKGKFSNSESYKMVISKNLQGVAGSTMEEDFEQVVAFGELEPRIAFTSSKAFYLSNKGNKNLLVQIHGLNKVNVTIYKIFQNNLQSFLRSKVGFSSYENDMYEDGMTNYGSILSDQTYNVDELPKAENGYVINMNIIDNIPDYKGVYVVAVKSTTDRWKKAIKLVALSDIGLIAKENEDEILVFANSILTAQTLKDVTISLVSDNNQEVLTAKTDGDGVAKFSNLKKKRKMGFRVTMATAHTGNDLTFLHFYQTAVNMSRFETGGVRFAKSWHTNSYSSYEGDYYEGDYERNYDSGESTYTPPSTDQNVSGYQAFIYGDRELYRPDETAYVKTIVRDKNYKPLAKVPVKIRVVLPNGKELVEQKGTLSEQGSFETQIKLPNASVTGTYTVEVYTSNNVFLNSKSISVEEFLPDRIKVTTNLDKESYKNGDKVTINSLAMNLFGTPAGNRKYEVNGTINRKNLIIKGLEDYDFTLYGGIPNVGSLPLREGETDENGKLAVNYELPPVKFAGLLEGNIYVTVFDETGRPVGNKRSFEFETQDIYYGVKDFDYYNSTRTPINIGVVAVNRKGQVAVGAKARVQIIRNEWQSVLERDYYNSYRYVSRKKEVIVQDQVITLQGKATNYPFVANRSGDYEVRVTSPDNVQTYVKRNFYAYTWGRTDNTSFEVDKDGEVKIVADKEKYNIGEKAKFLFKTPFAGKLLVTVEQGNVFKYFFKDTDKKAVEVEIPMENEYVPNVYITATLIKPASDVAIPLTVAHGFQSVTVENPANVIPVEIKAVEKSRSNITQEITVQCGKQEAGIEVTLAVVDEGILLKKRYENPNPYAFFFQKRALEVNTYDLYPRLFPEIKTLPKQYGADYYDLDGRLNPLANKRVKMLSFWSGTLRTDGNGQVKYKVPLPQFSGSVRIVAVAAKNTAFGSAAKNMIVADPLIVSTGLPRFLSPNDLTTVPVTITNTTNKAATGSAVLTTSGAVEIVGEKNVSIQVPANGEKQVFFQVKAKPEIGLAKIDVSVMANGEKFDQNIDITVRPSTSLLKTAKSGAIQGAASLDMKEDYLQTSLKGKLVLSKSPVVEFAKNLAYLVGYPYGCVEQTTSTAFPQIYFGEIAKQIGDEKLQNLNASYNVQQAINKLQTMQLYNGSLSYWEGGSYESWWGSVYAAHFLTEAQKAGYEVDSKVLNKLYSFLDTKLARKVTQDYYFWADNESRIYKSYAPQEVAYSMYVLALAGQANKATMNYYKANLSLLLPDSQYLLAMSYLLIGDSGAARSILPAKYEAAGRMITQFDGSFASDIRNEAIALNALIDTDPKNPQVEVMARHLSQQMKNSRYLNTQENAFGLLALGKLAKKNAGSNTTATITADGKTYNFTGATLTLRKEVLGKNVEIKTQGGTLYYYYEIEGLNDSGKYVEEDNFLTVRRSFYDRNGTKVNGTNFKQGELVVVRIDLSAKDTEVPNVVITDMLPAGFEIENPRLGNVPGIEWIKDCANAEHTDFRDDRINIFTTATKTTKSYYYVVRCVSKGTFKMGPVSADAMYNGEYHSYNGAGEVVVQ